MSKRKSRNPASKDTEAWKIGGPLQSYLMAKYARGPEWAISNHDKAAGDITWFITIPGEDFKEAVDGNRKVQNREISVSHWPRVHREEGLAPGQPLSKQGVGPQGPSSEDSEGYPSSGSEYNPEEK